MRLESAADDHLEISNTIQNQQIDREMQDYEAEMGGAGVTAGAL